jgi:competence protein ComEA
MFLCLILAGLVVVSGAVACGKSDEETSSSRRSSRDYDDEDGGGRRSRRGGDEEREAPTPPPTGPIKINEVTADELVAYKIPRLGQALAQKIIDYREENGPFTSIADVDAVPGVGPALIEKIQDRLDFGDAAGAASAAPAAGSAATASAPAAADAAAPAAPAVVGNKINVNTATVAQLVAAKIPRLGPALAQKIVDHRTANGPFKSLADLDNVSGVGPAMLEQLKDRVIF